MPNKRPPSSLFQNVSTQLKFFLFLSKLKKPILPLLLSVKKTRRMKKLKLLKHYSHCVKDYEFSPSSTPLIQFYRRPKNERFSFRKVWSIKNVHFISKCLGKEKEREDMEMELEHSFPCKTESCLSRELVTDLWDYDDQEDDSVDERAERFIQSFYEDMRRQRMESHLHDQLNAMLEM